MKRIALFGALADPQVAALGSALVRRGHQLIEIAPEAWSGDGKEGHALLIDASGSMRAELGLHDALDADAAYLRALPPLFPAIETNATLPPIDRRAAADYLLAARERAAFAAAIAGALEYSGRKLINSARAILLRNRALELVRLARAGIRVVPSLVTDEPASAADLHEKYGRSIASGLTQDAAREPERGAYFRAPVLLQAAPESLARVFVLEGEVLAAACDGRAIEISPRVARVSIEASRALELRFAEVFVAFRPDRQDDFAVFSVNPSPNYLEVEQLDGNPITERLCLALENMGS